MTSTRRSVRRRPLSVRTIQRLHAQINLLAIAQPEVVAFLAHMAQLFADKYGVPDVTPRKKTGIPKKKAGKT